MKKYLLCIPVVSCLLSLTAFGAEDFVEDFASEPAGQSAAMGEPSHHAMAPTSSWAVGLSTLQWNESLTLQQGANSATDTANFSGLGLSLQREAVHGHWGWNFGGFIGVGQANGGGNATTVTYQKDKQNFSIFALTPRAFYRLTGRVSLGLTALGYVRTIDWPTDASGASVDAKKNLTLTVLADMNLRLSNSFDFYQGIGPLEKSGTFWKIGLGYRF